MIANAIYGPPINYAYKANGKESLGKEDFLQLLVLQLRTQDPLEPLKDRDFIAQLAQFNSLEQLINLNETMHSLSVLQALSSSTSLLGKEVVALKEDGEIEGIVRELGFSEEGKIIFTIDSEGEIFEVELGNIKKVR